MRGRRSCAAAYGVGGGVGACPGLGACCHGLQDGRQEHGVRAREAVRNLRIACNNAYSVVEK